MPGILLLHASGVGTAGHSVRKHITWSFTMLIRTTGLPRMAMKSPFLEEAWLDDFGRHRVVRGEKDWTVLAAKPARSSHRNALAVQAAWRAGADGQAKAAVSETLHQRIRRVSNTNSSASMLRF
jgi:hypothetical protein